jgi:hypothetical protein
VVRLLQSPEWFAAPHSARAREKGQRMKREYEVDSAITFLLIGLGIGSVLGIVLNPKQKQRVPLQGTKRVNRWRAAGFERQHKGSELREAWRSL